MALLAVTNVVVFTILWWNTKSRRKIDAECQQTEAQLHTLQAELEQCVAERTQALMAEEALRESEQRFRILFNQAAVGISQLGMDGQWLLVNQKHCDIVGYTHEELLKHSWQDLTHPDDIDAEAQYFRRMLADEIHTFSLEKRYIRSCGSEVWGHLTVSLVREPSGEPKYFIGVLEDIDERKRTQEALRESEQRFGALFSQAAVGIAQVGMDGRWLLANQKFCDILGYTREEVLERTFWNLTYPNDIDITLDYVRRAVADEIQSYSVEKRYIHKDGSPVWVNLTVSLVHNTAGEPEYFVSVFEDITERKRTEVALRESEQRFRTLFNQAGVGMSQANMDGRWLLVNQKFCDIVGYTYDEVLNLTWQLLTHPDDLEADLENVRRAVADEIQSYCMEKRYIHKNGSSVWVNLTVSLARESSGEPKYLIGASEDITERKRVEEELAQQAKELARSNAELQQFAYVASHDLQEPLRMIASYTQLLARRYKGRLDADADEFIAYAVDGATRMQVLINDLLAYSRVGTQGKEFERTDCETVLAQAIANLQIAIQESGALITHDPLPTVMADALQLGQLFQNLIGNAIKFHGNEPPQIHVSAQLQTQEWVFSVRDNGIGIDPQYAERIFIIFQRLHNPSEYPGSGIGLAICKKIVERHGGRIWMQSQVGGSVFYFTISEAGGS